MNELNMSIYSGKDGEHKVTFTAAFDNHEDAVDFHTKLAALCGGSAKPTWLGQLIPKRTYEQQSLNYKPVES